METKHHIAPAFAGFFYLGGIDLRPVPIEYYPWELTEDDCRRLFEEGWIFMTERDALAVREVMVRAYFTKVLRLKGTDAVKFSIPRGESFYDWLINRRAGSDE